MIHLTRTLPCILLIAVCMMVPAIFDSSSSSSSSSSLVLVSGGALEDLLAEGTDLLSGQAARDTADRQLRDVRKTKKNPEACAAFTCKNTEHVARPKNGHVPTSNGCGSYGFKIHSKWHESCCDRSQQGEMGQICADYERICSTRRAYLTSFFFSPLCTTPPHTNHSHGEFDHTIYPPGVCIRMEHGSIMCLTRRCVCICVCFVCCPPDKCFSTCGSTRTRCDTDFKKCMMKKCTAFSKPHQRKERDDCEGQAQMLFTGTRALGCQAYLDSQAEACTCGPREVGRSKPAKTTNDKSNTKSKKTNSERTNSKAYDSSSSSSSDPVVPKKPIDAAEVVSAKVQRMMREEAAQAAAVEEVERQGVKEGQTRPNKKNRQNKDEL